MTSDFEIPCGKAFDARQSSARESAAEHASVACAPSLPSDAPISMQEIDSPSVFHEFALQHHLRLIRYFLSRNLQLEDAQDLAQEAIFTHWQKRAHSKPPHDCFLFGIARRILSAFNRKRPPGAISLDSLSQDGGEQPSDPADVRQDRQEPPSSSATVIDDLLPLMESLSPNQRLVFLTRFVEGFSRRQTAEKLSMSRRSVETHELRAVAALQKIAAYPPDDSQRP